MEVHGVRDPAGRTDPPRWIADEMLGRLARYLRFLGHDTEYVRGLEDEAIAQRAASDRRVLLTRDRDLAARTPGALLLRSSLISDQLAEVRRTFPGFTYAVAFDRCPECNGTLAPWSGTREEGEAHGIPSRDLGAGRPVFACRSCQRYYWEGSHTKRIRELVAASFGEPAP